MKQWLAFPMYLTAVWLAWVFGKQRGVDALGLLLVAAVLLALALWWLERRRFRAGRVGALLPGLALALAIAALVSALRAAARRRARDRAPKRRRHACPTPRRRWRSTAPKAAQVFIDMTADWCITCKVNEKAVFAHRRVRGAARAHQHRVHGRRLDRPGRRRSAPSSTSSIRRACRCTWSIPPAAARAGACRSCCRGSLMREQLAGKPLMKPRQPWIVRRAGRPGWPGVGVVLFGPRLRRLASAAGRALEPGDNALAVGTPATPFSLPGPAGPAAVRLPPPGPRGADQLLGHAGAGPAWRKCRSCDAFAPAQCRGRHASGRHRAGRSRRTRRAWLRGPPGPTRCCFERPADRLARSRLGNRARVLPYQRAGRRRRPRAGDAARRPFRDRRATSTHWLADGPLSAF